MTGMGSFREYRKFFIALVVLAVASPLGLWLPKLFKAEGAWGEWGAGVVKKLLGYAPKGLEKLGGLWKAPLRDYALPGQEGGAIEALYRSYILSGLIGIVLCVGVTWALGRLLARKK